MARTKSDAGEPREASTKKQKKPKKQRWYHQVWAAFKMTRRQDPMAPWIMLAVFVGVIAVALLIGFLTDHPIYAAVVGVPFALLAAMFVLTRKAERAAYTQIEGQPGAVRAALGTVRGGWTFDDEPIAVNRQQDLVFRGIGRPGVVLVSEGPSHRVQRMLDDERRRTGRVLPNVPITLIQVGTEEGQVRLPKVARKVQKLKKKLTRAEAAEVGKRLKALGGVRLPVPKGVDPMKARPDRKGMRGR
jgi:F0F1-type ATP synthase assembly protein I